MKRVFPRTVWKDLWLLATLGRYPCRYFMARAWPEVLTRDWSACSSIRRVLGLLSKTVRGILRLLDISGIHYSLLVSLMKHFRDILGLWSDIHRVMLEYSLISTHFNFQQLVIGGITGGCWSWDIPSNIQFNAHSWRNTFFLWKDNKTLVEFLHEFTISTTSRLKTHSFLVTKSESPCWMWLATCEQLCRLVSIAVITVESPFQYSFV